MMAAVSNFYVSSVRRGLRRTLDQIRQREKHCPSDRLLSSLTFLLEWLWAGGDVAGLTGVRRGGTMSLIGCHRGGILL